MPQRKPPTPGWKRLISAVGGNAETCDALNISPATLYSASRGLSVFPPEKQEALKILADLHEVDNPLDVDPPPRNTDLAPLRRFGEELELELPIADSTVSDLKRSYPTHQLIELAEGRGTPASILRAVAYLLESD